MIEGGNSSRQELSLFLVDNFLEKHNQRLVVKVFTTVPS